MRETRERTGVCIRLRMLLCMRYWLCRAGLWQQQQQPLRLQRQRELQVRWQRLRELEEVGGSLE